jgi:CRISPR-associated protein Cmx8
MGATRIEPESFNPDDYERVRRNLWNREFRRQRVLNILNWRKWHAGFDKLLSRLPFKLGFDGEHFAHDARESFKIEVRDLEDKKMDDAQDDPFTDQDTEEATEDANERARHEPKSIEALTYRVVSNYVRRKLKDKYDLEYSEVREGKTGGSEFYEKRRKVAADAFYSVRSRTGFDFVEYFAATICSVPQFLPEQDFESLARELRDNPNNIRTLTMLALSARSYVPTKQERKN